MKPRSSRMSLRAAALALCTLAAFGAQAQTGANGRLLFKQKNCALCHFYEARSIAPSVKSMKAGMKGDPAQAAAAISSAAGHAGELKSISADEIRAIAEWLAATTFAEQEAATAAKPKPGSPEAKALAKKEAAAKAKAAAEAKAQAKQEAAAKAKQEAEAKAQARKDAAAKAKQEAEAKAQAKLDAEAQGKREAAAKHEQAELARREADAKARKDSAALDAIKREGEERARREAEAQANAKRDAEALAAKKREADERAAKQESEAKARREADALAAQKRDADERAKREAEAKAKAETLATQKREAEAPAQAKKSEAAAPAAKEETAKPGARKKLAYRDGSDLPPCAAPTGAPLGAIDEAGAKAVIDRVGCPQCHAYVQKKTGPPMKQIHEKYKGDWECVVARLTKNKTHKEEGVTDDMKGNEFKIVADYIATRAK